MVFTLNFSFSCDELPLKKYSLSFSSEVHFWKGVDTPEVETPGKEGNQTKTRKKPQQKLAWVSRWKKKKKIVLFSPSAQK